MINLKVKDSSKVAKTNASNKKNLNKLSNIKAIPCIKMFDYFSF